MSALPFPRSRKVRRHADFQRIQSGGPRAGGAGLARDHADKRVGRATSVHFVFLVARTPGDGTAPSRLGLVVTKKIGSAVDRNRVKRVCRECFRRWPDFLPAGIDLLVIARQGAPGLGLVAVREEWSRARGALRHRAREALAYVAAELHVSAEPRIPTAPPAPTRPTPNLT